MAAIAGVLPRIRGCRREALTRVVTAMRDALARRAPLEGGAAVAYDASIALAHRGGGGTGGDCVLQPLRNENGTLWLVADGEPSNAGELRLELIGDGHRFQSGSGSEVILHLYERHGIAGIERLAGAFAFALWDRQQHELVLGRDRFGEKPLYFSDAADRFSFASEVGTLAADGELDVAALTAFLTLGFIPEPRTALRGVRAVPPGAIVRVRGERVRVQGFWDETSDAAVAAPDAPAARLGYLLRAAVHGAVDREEHAGLLLDGRVASAALLALVRPVLGSAVRSHALAFAGGDDRRARRRSGDDGAGVSRTLASWFHSEFRDHAVDPAALAAACDAAADGDQPSLGAAVAHLGAASLRAAGERVWLSALAPPELFGAGAPGPAVWSWRAGRHRPARLLLRAAAPVASWLRPFSAGARLWSASPPASVVGGAYLAARGVLAPAALRRLLAPEVLAHAGAELDVVEHLTSAVLDPVGPIRWPVVGPPRAALARAIDALDLRGPLMCGALRDQEAAASANALALRTPFLDHHVYECLRAAPTCGRGVRVLQALDAAMPARLVRSLTAGAVPFGGWTRSRLAPVVEPHLRGDDPDRLFLRDGLEALWREFVAGRADVQGVWAVATLRAWLAARRRRQAEETTRRPAMLGLDAA